MSDRVKKSDLTPKQLKFAEAYLDPNKADFVAMDAARIAGYKHARSSANDNMLPDSPTKMYIDQALQETLHEAWDMLLDKRKDLTRAAMEAAIDGSASGSQVSMLKDLLDRVGMSVPDEHHVTHRGGISVEDADKLLGIHRQTEDEEGDE